MTLPKFVSHKTVEGFKIGGITAQALGTHAGNVVPPAMFMGKPCAQKTEYIFVSECGEHTVVLGDDYIERHHPHLGGYYVRYADGYQSFSPAEAFENGYVQTNKRRVLHLTIDDALGFSVEDMENMMHMFNDVIHGDAKEHGDVKEAVNFVVASCEGVRAEFVDVQDSPEVELVTVRILNDEPVECDADGKRIIHTRVVNFRVDGDRQPSAEQFTNIVEAFAPLLDDMDQEIVHADIDDYSIDAETHRGISEITITATLKDSV